MCFFEKAIKELFDAYIAEEKQNWLTEADVQQIVNNTKQEIPENIATKEDLVSTLYTRYSTTSLQSMNDLIQTGIYGWSYSTRPYDCPIADSGVMLVLQHSKAGKPEYGRLVQIIYSTYGTFTRYRTTTKWSEWQCGGALKTPDSIRVNAFCTKCNGSFTPAAPFATSSKTMPEFKTNTIYHGIPYSARHYDALDVFYNTNLDSLFSMINNLNSKIYQYQKEGQSGSVYTGAVCSSFVSYICNLPIYYTTYDMAKMLNYKEINDIEDIEIGDVLICHTTWGDSDDHVMIVSNIITDMTGVAAIEVAEMWNPLFRKVLYEKDKFMGLLYGTTRKNQKYRVGRFDNQSIRSMQPIEVNSVLMTEKGNKVYYELGEEIILTTPKNKKITVSYNDEQEIIYDITNYITNKGCNITSIVNRIGNWKITNPEETSEVCYIKIIQKGTATIANNYVTLKNYTNCKPCGYAVVGIRKGGSGNYPSCVDGCTATRLTIYKKEDPRYAGTITADTTFVNTAMIKTPYIGYYVRIFYDTGFGQTYQDTNVIML